MNAVKPISVTIPPADVWRLEDAAEQRGMTLARFMYQSALTVAGFGGGESLQVMHEQGATVKQIAARLNMTNQSVKYRIKQLGLTRANTNNESRSNA